MARLALAEAVRAPAPAPGDSFRAAMRQLASGVSLITHGDGPNRTGLTATSVSSLSSDPPTLLLCVNRTASISRGLRLGEPFGVSVLSADQSELADVFAGRNGLKGSERFAHGKWLVPRHGVALLAHALANFECEVEDLIERHTHVIVIGRVRQASTGDDGAALLYWRGDYDRLGWRSEEVSRAVGATSGVDRGSD